MESVRAVTRPLDLGLNEKFHSMLQVVLHSHRQCVAHNDHNIDPWSLLQFTNNGNDWTFGLNYQTYPLKLTTRSLQTPASELQTIYTPEVTGKFLKRVESIRPDALIGIQSSVWGGNPKQLYDPGIALAIGMLMQASTDASVQQLRHGYDLTSKTYVLLIQTQDEYWVLAVDFKDILPIRTHQ